MKKVEININDKKYMIDLDKAVELGILEEEKFDLMPERVDGGVNWYINMSGNLDSAYDEFTRRDNQRYDRGNYFKSEEVARYIIDNNMNPFNKIHNYIAHKNVEIRWKADWSNVAQRKWSLYFDDSCKMWMTGSVHRSDKCSFYSTKEVIYDLRDKLNKAIQNNKENSYEEI